MSRYLCIDKENFQQDYSNRVKSLRADIPNRQYTWHICTWNLRPLTRMSRKADITKTHQYSPIVTNIHQISPIWTNLDQIWKHHLDFPYCNTVYIWQCKFRNAEMNTFANKDISLSKTSMLNVLITKNIPNCN